MMMERTWRQSRTRMRTMTRTTRTGTEMARTIRRCWSPSSPSAKSQYQSSSKGTVCLGCGFVSFFNERFSIMQQFTRKPRRGEESVSLVVGSRQPRRRILVLCEQAKCWGKTQFKDCIFKTNKQRKLTLKTTELFMQYRKRLLLCRSHWCCSKCTLPSHWKIFCHKNLYR